MNKYVLFNNIQSQSINKMQKKIIPLESSYFFCGKEIKLSLFSTYKLELQHYIGRESAKVKTKIAAVYAVWQK